jgi:hypothetical protein
VSKTAESPKSRLKSTAGAVPWLAIVRGAMIVGRRWNSLSGKERARLAELVRESRGRTSNLSVKQRLELRKLAGRLDLKGMLGELTSLWRGGRGRRGRKRH